MSEALITLIDLPLAWRLVKWDLTQGRIFASHPYEKRLIEVDLDLFLQNVEDDLRHDHYFPDVLKVCDVPKPNGAVRPGAILSLRDQIVYAASTGACFQRIRTTLNWPQNRIDFSYSMPDQLDNGAWFSNSFRYWSEFRTRSLSAIDNGAEYVVMADVAGYYENIDLSLLISDLRAIGIERDLIQLLSKCLNRWATSSQGIPQGFSPSDILGKLYLNVIDRGLAERDYNHVRYVDDYRIFCRNLPQARCALMDLIKLFRSRGLIIQTEKSRIYSAEEAREKIDGIQPILQEVLGNFVDEVAEIFVVDQPYFHLGDAEQILANNPNDTPIEIIRDSFDRFFVHEEQPFNKTLFHFLLGRLGNARDSSVLTHVLAYLRSHPEETEFVLKYIDSVGEQDAVEENIVDSLNALDSVYYYQHYQVISWRTQRDSSPIEGFITLVRSLLFETQIPQYLRLTCMEFLAKFGSVADIDRIGGRFEDSTSELDRAEVICAIRRMEVGRRNTILGRFPADNGYTARAVRLVRSGQNI